MTDRKKMINELTYQINSNEVMRQHYPVQLSVTDARKILELLKEQEPRVLTWDEVKRVEVCWTEPRGYEPYAELYAADWNPKCYGKTIRCWSAKPTKKQQEAVKWDE